jgi:hypothetical protein
MLRAGVFTATAIVLAALGHSCAAATVPAPVALLAAGPVVYAVAWWLASRERRAPFLVAAAVAVQLGLHVMLARTGTAPAAAAPPDLFWCHVGAVPALPAGGTAWPVMLLAHTVAAAAAGLWMRRGERALASLLRLLAAGSARVVSVGRLVPCIPARLRPFRGVLGAVRRSSWRPRRLLLLQACVARRGPPLPAC